MTDIYKYFPGVEPRNLFQIFPTCVRWDATAVESLWKWCRLFMERMKVISQVRFVFHVR